MNWKIGDRVSVTYSPEITGTVAGFGAMNRGDNDTTRLIYLVELDKGFYNPTRSVYVSTLAADGHNLCKLFEL